jgi:hypothetical protein
MTYATCYPIHEIRVVWIWKQSSVWWRLSFRLLLLHRHSLIQLLLLFLLPSSLFLLSSLPLCPVVQQECQSAAQSQNDERLENIRINIVAVVAVTVVVVAGCMCVIEVIRLVFIPAGEFGFEESVEPLRKCPLFLDDCSQISTRSVEMFSEVASYRAPLG